MRDALAATDHRPRNNKEIILTEKTEEILLGKQKRYCWENRDDKEKTEASPRCGVVTSLFFLWNSACNEFFRVEAGTGRPAADAGGAASALLLRYSKCNVLQYT